MLFLFKKPTVVIDTFTANSKAYEFTHIQKATKFVPEWWKNLKPNQNNMKTCAGFVDLYTKSFVLPFWSDVEIFVSEKGTLDYTWQFSDGISEIHSHLNSNHGNRYAEEDFVHLKFVSPWWCKSKKNSPVMVSNPIWNRESLNSLHVVPGVLNFKYQFGTHINCFVQRTDKPQKFLFEYLEPLAFLTPMTENNVVFKKHLISDSEIDKIFPYFQNNKFFGSYKLRKKLIDQKESRCPFKW